MAENKRNPGRRTKLTAEVQDKIVSAIRAGNYAHVAAGYAGIGERTFYRWLQKGREAESGIHRQFWQAIKGAERESEVRAVALVQRHMSESWQCAMTYLERKHPDRWGRRDRLRVEVEPKKVLTSLLGLDDDNIDTAVDLAAQHRDETGESS